MRDNALPTPCISALIVTICYVLLVNLLADRFKLFRGKTTMERYSFDPSRILWKAGFVEEVFCERTKKGISPVCYNSDFVSKNPITESVFEEAALHLFRKHPNLRVCLQLNDFGELFVSKMNREKVLVKMSNKIQWYDAFHEETLTKFDDLFGPLWRITIIPIKESELHKDSLMNGFIYQYHVLFGFHHSITDGFTNVRICGSYLRFLNSLMNNQTINDEEQLLLYWGDTKTLTIMEETKDAMKENTCLYDKYTERLNIYTNHKPHLRNETLLNQEIAFKFVTLCEELSEDLTEKFIQTAKRHGITVNSAFCAFLIATVVEQLRDSNIHQDIYNVHVLHAIDVKRYWKDAPKNISGCHTTLHIMHFAAQANILTDFWNCASLFHEQFSMELSNMDSLYMAQLQKEMGIGVNYSNGDIGVTNVGDVTIFFRQLDGSDFDSVRALSLRRHASSANFPCSGNFFFHTLNGKLFYSLSFDSQSFPPAEAEQFLLKLKGVIRTVFADNK